MNIRYTIAFLINLSMILLRRHNSGNLTLMEDVLKVLKKKDKKAVRIILDLPHTASATDYALPRHHMLLLYKRHNLIVRALFSIYCSLKRIFSNITLALKFRNQELTLSGVIGLDYRFCCDCMSGIKLLPPFEIHPH